MAIQLKAYKKDTLLFCCSKWWGNPDLPPQVEYPMYEDYPLTFICQIDCEDIAPLDSENLLPHEGMLYFFAAIDSFLGYDTPYEMPQSGVWPLKSVVVKYSKHINPETFNSCILVDDEDNELVESELAIDFSLCEDDAQCIKLLSGNSSQESFVNLLQLVDSKELGIKIDGEFSFILKDTDLKFGNFKRSQGLLTSH